MESIDQTTQQLMFSLIEIWKGSEKTQQTFCKEKNLDYNKFQYWLRRHKQTQAGATPDSDQPRFKQIRIKESQTSAPSVELVFPDGRKLIFHQPVEASFLRNLLA